MNNLICRQCEQSDGVLLYVDNAAHFAFISDNNVDLLDTIQPI